MSFIKSELKGAVFLITLNRPEKFNSVTRELALQLQDALDKAGADERVRAIYISGEGKAFCAGQDLAEAMDGSAELIEKAVREQYNPIIQRIRRIEKPIVCGVNGIAAGAGANIALACDIVVAGKSASFVQAFSKIGLIPDSAGTFFLPRLIGLQRASALMMLGDKIGATEAMQMGMIYQVFADEVLQMEGMKIADALSVMPTIGIGLTKRLLNESLFNTLDKQLEAEMKMQAEAAGSLDFKEGVKAFLEKRKPVFHGK